ncbi:MAG TPA: hypothetical protein VKY32_03190 [Flavobacterium sp.]|nr:hypothetical protein [Flavobacterium sp.]
MMKKLVLFFLITVSLVGCQQKPNADTISFINGYWEIEEVQTPESETKVYTENTSVDYIELENSEGFRQKMMPQFDGKYLTNNLKENIKLTEEDNRYFLDCSTEYAQWREEIIDIDSTHLIIKNDKNITYKYKRFEPFNIQIDE